MIAFAIFLAAYAIPGWVIKPSNIRILVLSPDFWPYIVAGLIALGGVALLIQYYFITRKMAQEEEEPAPPGGPFRVVLVAVLMVGYYMILPYLGMVWSSAVAYVAFSAVIGLPRKVATVIVAILLPIGLYMFFAHAAGVPIPQAHFLELP